MWFGRGVVGLLVLGCPFLGFLGSAYFLGGHHADVAYFETVAQVIPILIVALAIEARYLTPRKQLTKMIADFYGGHQWVGTTLTILYTFIAFGLIVFSEGVALNAIASQDPDPSALELTTGGLAAGMIALITSIIIPAHDETGEPANGTPAKSEKKKPTNSNE